MALCVYAVVPRATRVKRSWRGLRAEPLRLVASGPIAVLVGTTVKPHKPDRSNLERHDALMRQIASDIVAMLPARFSLIVEDVHRLRALIETSAGAFHDALRVVAGCEQMTLRIRAPVAPPDVQRASTRRPAALRRSGTDYLLARAREFGIPQDVDVKDLLRRLSSMVHAERIGRAYPGDSSTIYHLIGRGRSSDYRAIVHKFATDHPSNRVAASGPFPPYAFCPSSF
jgi:Gas vesicle synthesis protein GvpL/GvpF